MKPKEIQESVDFPILKIVDQYLHAGGRIKQSHNRIVLVDKDGEYVCGGETTQKLLENCIWTFC